jgi:hypothetical protein
MWAYAAATLKQAVRSPMSWVLCGLGVFLGWFAARAAILDIDDLARHALPLTLGTAHLMGALLTLWLVGRSTEEDRHSGFASAADATRVGPRGRVAGRWLGASLAGCVLAAVTSYGICATASLHWPPELLLLSTSIQVTACVGAWGVLLGAFWRGGGAMLAVLLLYVLGHLPWGAPAFLRGPVGRALGAWLPGPRPGGDLASLAFTSAAVAGLLLLSLAGSRPSES